ncbi:hypothetical protein [Pyrobaculum aerophilum]|nr:hypothetical protein [Pyrobaculum aerophilum]
MASGPSPYFGDVYAYLNGTFDTRHDYVSDSRRGRSASKQMLNAWR